MGDYLILKLHPGDHLEPSILWHCHGGNADSSAVFGARGASRDRGMAKKQLFAFLFLGIFLEFWVVVSIFLTFIRSIGERIQIDEHINFSMGLKPPTRKIIWPFISSLVRICVVCQVFFPFYQLGREENDDFIHLVLWKFRGHEDRQPNAQKLWTQTKTAPVNSRDMSLSQLAVTGWGVRSKRIQNTYSFHHYTHPETNIAPENGWLED